MTLPPCELANLGDIELLLSNSFGSAALREKLSTVVESEGFVYFLAYARAILYFGSSSYKLINRL